MTKRIYLDYAGTTPMDSRVERVVLKHLKNTWGNASSVHVIGQQAKKVIEDSRKIVARIIGSKPEEIIFTGSGTESDNLAIFGVVRACKKYDKFTHLGFSKKNFGGHIITSKIEHHAVLRACEYLQKYEGFKITYLDVDKNGIINPASVAKALQPDTILVSITYANNEIGTIQPIAKIAKLIHDFRNKKLNTKRSTLNAGVKFPVFHTDACQAAGALSLYVNRLGVELMTLDGSKIYGPKAIGCLYVRRGISIMPLIVGGSQERGLRAGTANPALIAGFAKALELADISKTKESMRLTKLRDYTIEKIITAIPGSQLNGDIVRRLPNNINISFENIDGEMLMLMLDQLGIQVSTGSACTSTSTEPSHIIKALQRIRQAHRGESIEPQVQGKQSKNPSGWGNIRITLGWQTKKNDINYLLSVLPSLVKKLRDSFRI